MDTSLKNLTPVRVIEPRSNINKVRKLAVISGPKEVNFVKDVSTSYSTASVSHSIVPASNCVFDTKVSIVWYLTLTFVGTSTNSTMGGGLGQYDGPRSFPLSQCITSTTVTINGTSVSFPNYDVISGLAHYIGDKDAREMLSGALPFDDQYQNYSDGDAVGLARNPLAFYGENYYQAPRGSGIVATNQTSTGYQVQLKIIEPVFTSPLTWGKMQAAGLAGAKNLIFQFQIGDLTRVWSHASNSPDTISSLSVAFSQPPELYYQVLSPNQDIDPYRSDIRYEYPYFNITPYSTYIGALGSGSSATATSGNVTVTSIPTRFYVFVRQTNSNRTLNSSDTFAVIDGVNITWDNKSGLLNSASSHQLHAMSVKNGSNQSWQQWSNYQGSVLCVEFGSDIGLNENQAPGMVGNYQLQVQVTYRNTNASNSINYSIYVIPVLPGAFLLEGTQASRSTSLITEQDIIKAKAAGGNAFQHLESLEPFGGSFFGDLWSGIKDAGRAVYDAGKDVYNFIKPPSITELLKNGAKAALPYAKDILPVISPTFGPGLVEGLSPVLEHLLGAGYRPLESHKDGGMTLAHPSGGLVRVDKNGGLIVNGSGMQNNRRLTKKQLLSKL